MIRTPSIGLLALSRIPDDPRVRRQGDAFHKDGWSVRGIGIDGGYAAPPSWPINAVRVADIGVSDPLSHRTRLRRAMGLAAARLSDNQALAAYWAQPGAQALFRAGRDIPRDIWIANDWNTLPVAARLAAQQNSLYGYDTHELASEEFGEQRKWRLLNRPLVQRVERHFIDGAAVVSTVSDGIARELGAIHRNARPAIIVRNVTSWSDAPGRTTGSPARVLYHGMISPGRELETLINSVVFWRNDFELTLRGRGSDSYLTGLRELTRRQGIEKRVHFEPAIAMTELVDAARAYDVGIVSLPDTSLNNRLALPNKFFEYIMAGLSLCVPELPEMAQLVRQYKFGVTFTAASAQAIAAAINGLTPQKIDLLRANARNAAAELCWDKESRPFVAAYRAAVAGLT